MDKILTVVIPAYNGEKYVARAARSVLEQPAGAYVNVLLVDDGSTDSTDAICDDLARAHENVQVIHKSNGGVSSARNMGIDNVTTKYIAFLDCDDWWNEEFFDEALARELVQEDGCDVYQFAYQEVDGSRRLKKVHPICEEKIIFDGLGQNRYDWEPHCSFVIRTALLHENGIRYPICRSLEDGPFIEMALCCAKTYQKIDRIIFSYWKNENSCSHTAQIMNAILEEYKGVLQKKERFEDWGLTIDADSELVWSIANSLPKLCAGCGFRELQQFMDEYCFAVLACRPDIRFGKKMWSRLECYRKCPRWCWIKYRVVPGIPMWIMSCVKQMPRVYKVLDYVLNRLKRRYIPL